MATVTTLDAIRDNIVALLRALDPHDLAAQRFDLVPEDQILREWAAKGGDVFRRFEVVPSSGANGATTALWFDARQTLQSLSISVAYPRTTALYGRNDLRDMERIMRQDAAQVRTAVFSPANALDGQITRSVDIMVPQRAGAVFFQDLIVNVEFTEAQVLAT
jgi:hypothetical protein